MKATVRSIALAALCIIAFGRAAGAQLPGFSMTDSTHWEYEVTGEDTVEGILYKPDGDGPFPAIVISHGKAGNALENFTVGKAQEMVTWGFVCIGALYTHGEGGAASEDGARPENMRRAAACIDILKSFDYVDEDRIAAYGNSMGAFVTIQLAADRADDLVAAAITAGGIVSTGDWPAPNESEADGVEDPFLMLHGTADTTVPPERSELLQEVLDGNSVPNERRLYEDVGHGLHSELDDEVYMRIHDWFNRQGVFTGIASSTPTDDTYSTINSPTQTRGTATELYADASGNLRNGFLKFTVSGVVGLLESATLKLRCTDSGTNGKIYAVSDTAWTEGTLTWNNQPSMGALLDTVSSVSSGTTHSFDVTEHVDGDGTFSLGVQTDDTDQVRFSTKEGAVIPVLEIEYDNLVSPPAAPSGLDTTPGDNQVILDWNDNSEGDLSGYHVFRAESSGGPYAQLNGSELTTSSYTDTDVSNGAAYYYVVTAVNDMFRESANSSEVSETPTADSTAPDDVANFQATPGDEEIDLSWTNPSDPDFAGVRIQRSTTGFPATINSGTTVYDSTGTTHNDTGLTNETMYYYTAFAYDEVPNYSEGTGVGATPQSQAQIVFDNSAGTEDGWVQESSETSDEGGTAQAGWTGASGIIAGDNYQDRQYKGVLSFDTSALPDGATIVSATLRLRRGGVTGTNPFTTHGTCYVDVQTGGFNGDTALETADFEAAATVSQAATLSNAASDGDWSEGALNSSGRSAINKTGKTQFRVYFSTDDNDDNGNDYIGWYPGDNTTQANRPQLVVVYEE